MISNKQILNILQEYNVDFEDLCECVALACRKLFGVIEVSSIKDDTICAYEINLNNKVSQIDLKLTKNRMMKVVKETIKEIEKITREEPEVLKMLSYKAVLELLESDILTIFKKKVEFRVISTRKPTQVEQNQHPAIKQIIVISAIGFLEKAEMKYFLNKSLTLKSGVAFVIA